MAPSGSSKPPPAFPPFSKCPSRAKAVVGEIQPYLEKLLPMKTTRFPLFRACLAAGLVSSMPSSIVYGAPFTWNGSTTGGWAEGSSWIGGNAPINDATTDQAHFNENGSYIVSLSANRSVGQILLNGSANPVFDFGTSTLTTTVVYVHGGSASLTSGTLSGAWYHGYRRSNATFTLDGSTAAVLTTNGNIGYADSTTNASSNTLTIQNGAGFTSASGGFILGRANDTAANLSANSNRIEVNGTGSTFSAVTLNIGAIGSGSAFTGRKSNLNTLVINNGGAANLSSLFVGRVDGAGEASGNTVVIGGVGTGSALNLAAPSPASDLPNGTGAYTQHIGFVSSGLSGATQNIVTVTTGGTLSTNGGSTRIYGGTGNTGNALRIYGGTYDGGAKGGLLVEGKLFLGSSGSLTAKQIEVTAAGRFGDKGDNANAGFTSGNLNLQTMIYRPTVAFSVGDNAGSSIATYNMVGGGTHSFAAGMTIEETDGRLTGNGTIQGLSGANTTLTVNGILAPGNSVGTINVIGDLAAGANAVFNFEIASISSFDQLLITGDAHFDGTLNLTFLEDYVPEKGDYFKIFDFDEAFGAFSAINLAPPGEGTFWDVSQLYTTGMITVIPEPSSVMLLIGSGVGIARLLGRRRNG